MFVREPLTFQTKQHSHLLIQIVEDNEMKSFRLTVVLVLTVLFLTACPIKNSKPESPDGGSCAYCIISYGLSNQE